MKKIPSKNPGKPAGAKIVLENKVLFPPKRGDYVTARHVVVRGSDREIGRALASIAKNDFRVKLAKYDRPEFGARRKAYLREHYPMLLERMRGVADAYGVSFADDSYDLSGLPYDFCALACSSFYLAPEKTASGHALVARNMDFAGVKPSAILGSKPVKGEENMMSKPIILEVYPERGNAYIQFGSLDALNPTGCALNEKGIYIGFLANAADDKHVSFKAYGGKCAGLSLSQAMGLVASSCATIGEAKAALEDNEIYFTFFDCHFLVADTQGNSFVYDRDAEGGKPHFTFGDQRTQVMTNHPVYPGFDLKKMPVDASYPEYASVYRSDVLAKGIAKRPERLSDQQAWDVISRVDAWGFSHGTHGFNAKRLIPFRTIWTVLWDLRDRRLVTRFFLKDKRKKPRNAADCAFTKKFAFQLKK